MRCLMGETELKLLYRAWPWRGEISFSANSLKTISGTKCQGEHVIRNLWFPQPLEGLVSSHWPLNEPLGESVSLSTKGKTEGGKVTPPPEFKF